MKHIEYFVYEWTNSLGKRYIGYHKGHIDDSYVSSSSSENFWKDWKDPAIEWKREIIQTFDNAAEAIELERKLLKEHQHEILTGNSFYNNSINAGILFTDEVRNKISVKAKSRPSGFKDKKVEKLCCLLCKAEIALTQFEQHYMSKRCQGIPYYTPSKRPRIFTEAHKQKISNALVGKQKSDETRKKMSASRIGKTLSTETKQKISKSLTGENNSAYGKIWVNNGIKSKRVDKNANIPDDWQKGRAK